MNKYHLRSPSIPTHECCLTPRILSMRQGHRPILLQPEDPGHHHRQHFHSSIVLRFHDEHNHSKCTPHSRRITNTLQRWLLMRTPVRWWRRFHQAVITHSQPSHIHTETGSNRLHCLILISCALFTSITNNTVYPHSS